MTDEKRFALAKAEVLANGAIDALRLGCDRIEIAGSVRRRRPDVKDIEIVAIPRVHCDLFGLPTEVDDLRPSVDALVKAGKLAWRTNASEKPGRKFYPLRHVESGIPIDLFAVLPPAQWGAIMAIRTGPAEYAKHLVTICQRRGLRCTEGRLVRADNSTVETPEERDFIRECGAEWAEPEARR